MSNITGKYDCVVKSPMGDQKSVLVVEDNGDGTWTGTNAGDQGALACEDCTVDGSTIAWKSNMTVPMPMTLECTATIDGDTVTGSVKAGMFGTFPMNGTRQA
jgi:hypothetical protein